MSTTTTPPSLSLNKHSNTVSHYFDRSDQSAIATPSVILDQGDTDVEEDKTGTVRLLFGSTATEPASSSQATSLEPFESRPRSRNRLPLKKRPKGPSRAKLWKPLDPRDQADLDNAILSDQSQFPSSTSLDVHAKTFRPSSRISDIIASNLDRRNTMLSAPSTPDAEAELVIPRSSKSSGLNAYEIKTDAMNATVAATFNRRELVAVFSTDLPSPGICQNKPGQANGQVQFCVHPNGDVSAHQWSLASYQWLNIGQFSNIRKRTEGQLASDRLKGETVSQSLQQNTLAYFRAVAKQRELSVMQAVDKTRDGSLGLSAQSAVQSTLTSPQDSSDSSVMVSPKFAPDVIAAFKAHYANRIRPRVAGLAERMQRNAVEANVSLPQKFAYQEHRYSSIEAAQETQSTDGRGSMTRRVDEKGEVERSSRFRPGQTADLQDDFDAVSAADTLSPSDRVKHRFQDGEAPVQRTVLHDPLRGKAGEAGPALGSSFQTVTRPPGIQGTPVRSIPYNQPKFYDNWDPARSHGTLEAPFQDGTMTWGTITNDPSTGPTRQNFDGPFFTAGLEGAFPGHEVSYADKLNNWFTSGNKVERQDDFFASIVAANNNLGSVFAPGVIGTRNGEEQEGPGFDLTITRLMIPVIENLSSYGQGSTKRFPCMTRFTPPPEWCIDRSPSGNRSFFEQDWGKVPERIGRDERYRHLAYEGRYDREGRNRRSPRTIGIRAPVPNGLKFPA